MTFGSLFSGAAVMDLGLEDAGLSCAWQIEDNAPANVILDRHFPNVPRYGDIHDVDTCSLATVDLIAGGDPCPYRSRARTIQGSDATDLWPEFLRVVRGLRPLWVLRENVVSRDADDCWSDLCELGYTAIILEADSAEITGQSRSREYLCGVLESAGICPGIVFSQRPGDRRDASPARAEEPVARCLTTHPQRFDSRDNYILEEGRGIRILCAEERERLQGLRPGWTGGLSFRSRSRLIGNAVCRPLVKWIGHRIMETQA